MTETPMNGLLVADFKYGCRCMDCDKPILDGDPYTRRLVAFVDDVPASEVVCWDCALGGPDV